MGVWTVLGMYAAIYLLCMLVAGRSAMKRPEPAEAKRKRLRVINGGKKDE